jgi:hypothetical protein
MADDLDVLGRLRKYEHMDKLKKQAADEIERLRASLNIAAGKLSTLPPYTEWHPETIYKALLEDGVEAVRGE